MPDMNKILNDPVKWRQTMITTAEMCKNLASDLMKVMEGIEDNSADIPTALDELSDGED